MQPATYAHNTSPIPGTDHVTPFFLMFGRHAPSPEVLSFDLPPAPLSQSSYAKELIKRSIEERKTSTESKTILREAKESTMISTQEIFMYLMAKEFLFDFLPQVQLQKEQLPTLSGNTMALFWLLVTIMMVKIYYGYDT